MSNFRYKTINTFRFPPFIIPAGALDCDTAQSSESTFSWLVDSHSPHFHARKAFSCRCGPLSFTAACWTVFEQIEFHMSKLNSDEIISTAFALP